MAKKNHIDVIFDHLKRYLIEKYPGPKDTAELLIDVHYHRCLTAEKDHYRDSRSYMHVNHEDDGVICVSSSIEHLDVENIHGLFLHEIGHIIVDQVPQLYLNSLSEAEIEEINIGDPELLADLVIEKIWGITIRYDHNKVQWVKLEYPN